MLADPDLKRAYQRRVEIREKFLELMRVGYRRYKKPAPFDQGATAEKAATVSGKAGGAVWTWRPKLKVVLPAQERSSSGRVSVDRRAGNSSAKNLPRTWNRAENVVWHTELPGTGNSSPIIWGERIFLTSAGDEGAERSLIAFRSTDGKLLWTRTMPPRKAEPNVREKNGYASATPVTDGQRVIAFFGTGGLVAYDFAGRQLWQYDLPEFNTTWGTGSSPLLYEDSVHLVQDQNKADSIFVALDKRWNSSRRWRQSRGKAMGWSTPIVVRTGDRDELVYAGGESVRGYDPKTGRELWTMVGPTREVVPTILIGPDFCIQLQARQGPTLGLRPGGEGDVSDTHLAWRTPRAGRMSPRPCSTEVESIRSTIRASSRVSMRPTANCSGNHEFATSSRRPLEAKDCSIAQPNLARPMCCERATSSTSWPKTSWSADPGSPAALGNRLYLRTPSELFCLGK